MTTIGLEVKSIRKDKDGHYICEAIDIRTQKKVDVILTGNQFKELNL